MTDLLIADRSVEQLMGEFKRGNHIAFSAFFEQHYRPLCYFASRLAPESSEAEDIVKDAFVKLWQKHQDFDTPQNIKAFLYISTRNACLNSQRKKGVHEAYQKEAVFLEDTKQEDMVINSMIKAEFMERLYAEIEKLPEKRREIFRLAYIEGMKNDQIADFLGLSLNTVKEQKRVALNQLRLVFKGQELFCFLVLIEGVMYVQ